jgi:hypothetical protein
VLDIDGVPTIITALHGSLAKGYILNTDFSLDGCYVVKGNGYFAHGKTASEASLALRGKIYDNMDTDEVIERFVETFEPGVKYPCRMFYEWHHYLTGSCEMGRKAFMKSHGIEQGDMFTVEEFCNICENDYGGDIIKQVREKYPKYGKEET